MTIYLNKVLRWSCFGHTIAVQTVNEQTDFVLFFFQNALSYASFPTRNNPQELGSYVFFFDPTENMNRHYRVCI